MHRALLVLLTLGLLAACSGADPFVPDGPPPADWAGDHATIDSGGRSDGSLKDRGADAGVPLAGFGTISGQCGVLDDTEWTSKSPFLFRNSLDFGSATFDTSKLSSGGYTIWVDGNRGGSSLASEVFAYEMLYRCELAKLLKSETKIDYLSATGKKTDVLVEIDSRKIGVSVTRAYHYPPSNPYTEAEARALLEKKLADLPLSQANAVPQDAWVRSILHVFAYDSQYANVVESAWKTQVSTALKADAVVVMTVTDGNDAFIY